MNNQRYQYKHYDKDNSFIQVIDPLLVMSQIKYTEQINWGQGQLTIELNQKISDANYTHWDIIKVYIVNKYNKTWGLIYTWYIQNIDYVYQNSQKVLIELYGVASKLKDIVYKDGASYEFTKNDTASNIISDISTQVQAINSEFSDDITTRAGNLNIQFSDVSCFDAINDIKELTENYYWYIGEDWSIQYKEIPTDVQHTLTLWKDVDKIEIYEEGEIVNKVYLEYATGNKTYNNTTSQTTYWVREKRINKTSIQNEASADEFMDQFFTLNAEPKNKVVIDINNDYVNEWVWPAVWDDTDTRDDSDSWIETITTILWWIETVKPWEQLQVFNTNQNIKWVIEKIIYNDTFIVVTLDSIDNFIQLIKE